jgi:glyoxylase-like metal-dependent hydrolase (beta-lactamase superfamily II)
MGEVKVLVKGYTSNDSGDEKTQATISLIRDGDIIMVVDPGVLEREQVLIDALKKQGLKINDVNYVALTHSHLDHYRNIGLLPTAKTLEFYGIWNKNTVIDWKEDFTDNIKIIKTPGHSRTGISFLVNTAQGKIAVVGDVFWKENYPETDPYADDMKKLIKSRKLVLKLADFIIPGHADMFKVKK